jgi:hypothetical protein
MPSTFCCREGLLLAAMACDDMETRTSFRQPVRALPEILCQCGLGEREVLAGADLPVIRLGDVTKVMMIACVRYQLRG